MSAVDEREYELERRAEKAEADNARLDARVAELEGATQFFKELEDVELMFRGHAEDYVKMAFPRRYWATLCQALAGDGSATADALEAARKIDPAWTADRLREFAIFLRSDDGDTFACHEGDVDSAAIFLEELGDKIEALDRLDGDGDATD